MQKTDCEALRREIKVIADKLGQLRKTPTGGIERQNGEAYANATLAYRHLEDASMRLGKVIQVLDGGISVYDKDQVPAA